MDPVFSEGDYSSNRFFRTVSHGNMRSASNSDTQLGGWGPKDYDLMRNNCQDFANAYGKDI